MNMEFRVQLTPAQLKMSGFEAARGSLFLVCAIGAATTEHRFTLTDVQARAAPKGHEQFSVLFQGPIEPLLAQGTYLFSHDALGQLPLFMVPVGRNPAGVIYEVCVSRVVEGG